MIPKYYILFFSILICSCADNNKAIQYPGLKTIQIDSREYKAIVKQFKLKTAINSAGANLGGLTPKYPLASVFELCEDCLSNDWDNEGMICGCTKLIIKQKNQYVIVNSIEELKKIYAPINNEEEAISFAILASRLFAVFDEKFFKDSYEYVNGKPKVTKAYTFENAYIVNLFRYKTFGCNHPYSSVSVEVSKEGNIEILKETTAFTDPEDNSLCVD